MTDTITTARPAALDALGGWAVTGAASAVAALSDNLDASYVSSAGVGVLELRAGPLVLGQLDQLRYVQPWIRASAPGGARRVAVRMYGSGALQRLPEQQITLDVAAATYRLQPYRTWGTGRPFSAADLVALGMSIRQLGAGAAVRVFEIGWDLTYNQPPTVALDAVASPITDESAVSGSWAYADPEGDLQERYEERIYSRPLTGWPLTGAADLEVVALEAAGAVPIVDRVVVTDLTVTDPLLLPPTGTYRRYVRAADSGSAGRFGPWSQQEWTMAVDGAPGAPALVATPEPNSARVLVEITPAPGSPIDFIEVDRSLDGGVTWLPLRGTTPSVPYAPESPNVIDDGSFLRDTDEDGLADAWTLRSTPGGDALPVPLRPAGGGQRLDWAVNTGEKGLTTRPRVADDGSNIWPADSQWIVSFDWTADAADMAMLPVLDFDVAGFVVTWLQRPNPSGGTQGYSALIAAPDVDTVSDMHFLSTAAGAHHFTIDHVQLVASSSTPIEGYATQPYGTSPYGESADTADAPQPVQAPPYSARESSPLVIFDRSAPRRQAVMYRARQSHYAGSGAAWGDTTFTSEWATSLLTTLEADGNSWLQPASGRAADLAVLHAGVSFSATSDEATTALYPEGRATPLIVSGDLHVENPDEIVLTFQNDAEWHAFEAIHALQEPVLLRTLYGEGPLEQWWVRIGPQVKTERIGGYSKMSRAQLRRASFAAWQVPEPE
jgi:hypothetical protein